MNTPEQNLADARWYTRAAIIVTAINLLALAAHVAVRFSR
jgi:hypothetical protein